MLYGKYEKFYVHNKDDCVLEISKIPTGTTTGNYLLSWWALTLVATSSIDADSTLRASIWLDTLILIGANVFHFSVPWIAPTFVGTFACTES